MIKNRKSNKFIVLSLVLALCAASFSVAFGVTAEEKREEAKAAAKKAAAATENYEAAEKQLEKLQDEIEATKNKIAETKSKMKKKKAEIKQQEEDLNLRLTAMYKTGTVGFVDVILNSQDIEDLISNVGMVQKVLQSDQELLKKLEKDYKELDALKENLEDSEIALEAKETETEALKKKYKAEADKYRAQEEQLNAEADALAAAATQYSGDADELIRQMGGNLDTSNYSFPTMMGYTISSNYGWRNCPFHGREFHNGVDICFTNRTTYGTPVYAINDGKIIMAQYYGGYGNCIQIQCAGGVGALYGHLSGFNCKSGQYVTRGSVIGYIGSTGNSTGPHLHFCVFKNGVNVNPLSIY